MAAWGQMYCVAGVAIWEMISPVRIQVNSSYLVSTCVLPLCCLAAGGVLGPPLLHCVKMSNKRKVEQESGLVQKVVQATSTLHIHLLKVQMSCLTEEKAREGTGFFTMGVSEARLYAMFSLCCLSFQCDKLSMVKKSCFPRHWSMGLACRW